MRAKTSKRAGAQFESQDVKESAAGLVDADWPVLRDHRCQGLQFIEAEVVTVEAGVILLDEGAFESFGRSDAELCDRRSAGKDQDSLKCPRGSRHCQEPRQQDPGPNATALGVLLADVHPLRRCFSPPSQIR